MAEQDKPVSEKVVRLVWGPTEDVPVQYANHMSISFAGGTEFHLTFGYLPPPLAGLEADEIPDRLTIKPLVTIVSSPDVMRAFIQVLNGNLETFDKMLAEKEKK
jgi:hypothetical protein